MTPSAPPTGPGPLHGLRVAVAFLTRAPVRTGAVSDDDLRRASTWFPLVGVLVAAVEVGVRLAAGAVLPPVAAAVLAVAAAIAATGALHEDGLTDTVDGIWGGSNASDRLRIMRDSRLGTYGAVALVCAVVLRIALLAELDGWLLVRAVVGAHVLGRAAIVLAIRLGPFARAEGQGARVAAPLRGSQLAPALATVAAAAVLLGWSSIPALAAAVAVTVAVRELGRRRVGGLTGDLLGATQQLVLLTVLVVAVAAADVAGR